MKSRIPATLAVVFILAVLLSAPAQGGAAIRSGPLSSGPIAGAALSPFPGAVTHAVPAPAVGYPRTVLVETFTGVWCIHCPAESQALHNMDLSTNRSVLDVAELHVCAFPTGSGPCLENYVPPDGTSLNRETYYSVCGYPDVFFDGVVSVCGATNSVPQMQSEYEQDLSNASMIPGNVSIAQSAVVNSVGVVDHANITSAITGSYNLVTYLMEYIDKQNLSNGYGPHDVDHVVRETLFNHPVSLVAGTSTDVLATGAINSTWNDLNLSIVSFVQQNSTKIVENANQVPVTTLTTAVAANRTSLLSDTNATITVHVANTTSGAPVSGATVDFTVTGGASLNATSGITASDGSVSVSVQAPTVTSSTPIVVTAQVAAPGYTTGSGTITLVVNPNLAPASPTALTVAPGNKEVSLLWTPPTTGGAGVNYHVYRSATQTGVYTARGVATSASFNDTGLTGGQVYWYKVSAQNTGGFSGNTTAISAAGLTVASQGLPAKVGWWLSIDSGNFTSLTNASLALYLPNGPFTYEFGPNAYAFTAASATGFVRVVGLAQSINVSFTPRYANLQGTVSPTDATVTLNGSSIPVAAGSFGEFVVAGTYNLTVTAPGYAANSTLVILTPGNITTQNVQLQLVASGSPTSSSSAGGLTGAEWIVIAVGVIAVVALLGVAMMWSPKGKRRSPRPPTDEP